MKEKFGIRQIAGIGILTAIIALLQYLANVLPMGTLPFSLGLFPIALGAVMYGPLAGLFLGVVEGGMIIIAPSTQTFMAFNPWFTILLCLSKTGLAGLFAGLIYLPFKKKHQLLGSILASFICPIVNTGLFILGAFFVFGGAFGHSMNFEYLAFIFTVLIGFNFFIELLINGALSPALYKIYDFTSHKLNVGVN